MKRTTVFAYLIFVTIFALWVVPSKAAFLIPIIILLIIFMFCFILSLLAFVYPDIFNNRRTVCKGKEKKFSQKPGKTKKTYIINKYGEIFKEGG